MKNKFKYSLIILLLINSAIAQQPSTGTDSSLKIKPAEENFTRFDDTRKTNWPQDFEVVEIKSSKDNTPQKSYFYRSKAGTPKPLIVSLHTWSGDYTQKDEIAPLCREKALNYIHPDFRGVNSTANACGSELALADIDDAITYAIRNANVDTGRIYVIGVSGGGFATLSTFMKSGHAIKKFSAWASIADLEAWYHESSIRKNKYAADILRCTGSNEELNVANARQRSPLYMATPQQKPKPARLFIFAGIYDGIQGSVPITQSINFYNKLLNDLSVKDKSTYVSSDEKLQLLEHRRPLGNFGSIGDRRICLKKQSGNIELTIFEGAHEMLPRYAIDQLLSE
jgi:predicted peptidase